LSGPGSTVTWGPSVALAQGLKLEARSAENGVELWGGPATGPGERCEVPQSGPRAAKGFDALYSQMTSPAIGNPACTVQVCHFTHFRHACKSNSSVAGLDHHRPTSAKAEHKPIANCNIILFTVNYTYILSIGILAC